VAIQKISTGTLGNDSVTAAQIAPGTIVDSDIANDAVTTVKILNANVTTAKIADANVTTAKITDANVTTAKIANDAVTTAKILASNVTNAKMADDAIGIAELSATGTASSSTFLRGDNSWAAAGAGTPTLLTTLNTTSGTELTTATLNLTTYKTIYVKITNIGQGTDTGSKLQWKNNGGTYQDIFNAPSDTSESGHSYIICRPTELIPNYYQWTSPWGTRGRDWNVAVGGGPNYKYTTAMMILPSTTSISFKWASGQTFNLGQILIYGQT